MGTGAFCVKLDSDDILEPQFVEVLLDHLQKHPQAGWAHCNITNITPEGQELGLAHSRKKTGYYSAPELFSAYLSHNDTCHCVMIRKSAYQAVGGYRPEMKTCEDWLLWLEMILGGWGHCFDARPLARMRKYDSRPELMTRRRKEFIVSARLLVDVMRRQLEKQTPLPGGMAPEAALERLRDSVARLCKSSGLHEADRVTRRELFAAANDFSPRFSYRLWAAAGYRAPLVCLEGTDWLAGLPRRWARSCYQKFLCK